MIMLSSLYYILLEASLSIYNIKYILVNFWFLFQLPFGSMMLLDLDRLRKRNSKGEKERKMKERKKPPFKRLLSLLTKQAGKKENKEDLKQIQDSPPSSLHENHHHYHYTLLFFYTNIFICLFVCLFLLCRLLYFP